MEAIDDKWLIAKEKPIKENINELAKSGLFSLVAGSSLLVIALIFAAIMYCNTTQTNCCFSSSWLCNSRIYTALIITILAEVCAFILLMGYKSSLKQIEFYRNELVVLRDLSISIELCNEIPDSDKEDTIIETKIPNEIKTTTKHKSKKSEIKQQIIQTLLNRCGN
jgi:hypothetical protein